MLFSLLVYTNTLCTGLNKFSWHTVLAQFLSLNKIVCLAVAIEILEVSKIAPYYYFLEPELLLVFHANQKEKSMVEGQ